MSFHIISTLPGNPMHDPEDTEYRNPREKPHTPPPRHRDKPHHDDDPRDPRSVPPKEICVNTGLLQ